MFGGKEKGVEQDGLVAERVFGRCFFRRPCRVGGKGDVVDWIWLSWE